MIHYENLLLNLEDEIRKLASFLNFKLDETRLKVTDWYLLLFNSDNDDLNQMILKSWFKIIFSEMILILIFKFLLKMILGQNHFENPNNF